MRLRVLLSCVPLGCTPDSTTVGADGGDDTSSSTSDPDPGSSSGASTASSGSESSGVDSSESGALAQCGNGELEGDEECDDGNVDNVDACTDTCTIAYEIAWTAGYNGPLDLADGAGGVAINAAGDVFVAGSITTDTDRDLWVRQYSADGAEGWTFTWNSDDDQFDGALAIEALPGGDLVVAGRTGEGEDIHNALIMRLSADGSTVVWLDIYDGPLVDETAGTTDRNDDLVLAPDSGIIVVGRHASDESGEDVWVRRYTDGGNVVWTDAWDGGGGLSDEGAGVAFDPDGNVVVIADAETAVDVHEAQVRTYSGDGDILLTQSIGAWRPESLAIDSEGNLAIAGWFDSDPADILVAKFDPDLAETWSLRINGPAASPDFGEGIALDAEDNIYVVGHWGVADEGRNIWVAKFDPAGEQLWGDDYNNEEANLSDQAFGIAVGEQGQVVAVGRETVFGQFFDAWARQYQQL